MDGELDTFGLLQPLIQVSHGIEDTQTCPYCALGVIFMCLGIPKIDEESIPKELSDVSFIASNYPYRWLGRHERLPVVFRVELGGELGGIDQVSEQHRELTAFSVRGLRRSGGGRTCMGWTSEVVGENWLLGSRRGGERGHVRTTCPDQDAAVLIHRQALSLDEFGFQIFQIRVIELKLPLERHRSGVPGAGAWLSPGRGFPQRSSPTLPRPMRCAEDGVGIGTAVWAYVYRT